MTEMVQEGPNTIGRHADPKWPKGSQLTGLWALGAQVPDQVFRRSLKAQVANEDTGAPSEPEAKMKMQDGS